MHKLYLDGPQTKTNETTRYFDVVCCELGLFEEPRSADAKGGGYVYHSLDLNTSI